MPTYRLKLVEIGSDLDKKEPGKFYYDDGGVRYEIQNVGDRGLSPGEIMELARMARPQLEEMSGDTLELVLKIEEKSHRD